MTDTPNPSNPFKSPVAPSGPPASDGAAELDAALADDLAVEFRRTRPLVWIVAIIGFLVAGACVVLAAVFIFDGGFDGRRALLGPLVFFGSLAALYLAATLLVRRFAMRIRRFLRRPSFDTLEETLGAHTACWRLCGVVMLVVVGFYGVMLAFALAMIATQGFG